MEMMSDYEAIKLNQQDLVDNPETRVPVCFCIDTSGSMNAVESGSTELTGRIIEMDGKKYQEARGGVSRIELVNEGLSTLFRNIKEDDLAHYSAEIAVVTFDSQAYKILDFANIDRQGEDAPKLTAERISQGNTFMGEGVNLALDLLEARKQQYKNAGNAYFQPWLVLMTDGEANGSETELQRAIQRTNDLVNRKKLVVFPIAMGNDASKETLAKFSPERTPLKIANMKYKEFFEFIGKNLIQKSNSMAGENIKVTLDDLRGWSEL